MSDRSQFQHWRQACLAIAKEAGEAILDIYAQAFDVRTKDDASPLTLADEASHRVIANALNALTPDIPVLSEEGAAVPWETRARWSRFWLVDPLDGTREFVKRNGEFTVNIALIDDGVPVIGVIYAPALDYMLHAEQGVGAFLKNLSTGEDIALSTQVPATAPLRVAASRSHLDPRTEAFLKKLGDHTPLGMGSSLKFCKIAEGGIDLYPRFGPTSEWDTAAGQCILESAGGAVLTLDGNPLRYNCRESLLNPHFVAVGDPSLAWETWVDGLDH